MTACGCSGRAPWSPSYRVVPLGHIVVAALNQHIARYQVPADGLVFTLGGEPITTDTMRHLLTPIKAAVGMTPATGTGLHAPRHYYARLLIRHGESVKVVPSNLGHASAVETLDTYAHPWPGSADRREMLWTAFSAVLRTPRGPAPNRNQGNTWTSQIVATARCRPDASRGWRR
ncbi:tyrosine-type recombinase/integrase [Microbacterium sp. NPDC056052]|uniref:tyrosine-type recombinase/integrase n=1 Tax=Microbacterium sp. NPDC056052 TaxID=3345695 RepID=UPI0035DD4294